MLNISERERETTMRGNKGRGTSEARERECSDKVRVKFGSHSHRSDIKIFP